MTSLCRNLVQRRGGLALAPTTPWNIRSHLQRVKEAAALARYQLLASRSFTISSVQHRGDDWKSNSSNSPEKRKVGHSYSVFDELVDRPEHQPYKEGGTRSNRRISSGRDYLYSPNVVIPAMQNGFRTPYTLYYANTIVQKRKKIRYDPVAECIGIAEKAGIRVVKVSKHDLNDMSQQRPHQGVVLEASKLEELYIKALSPLSPDNTYTLMVKGMERTFSCRPNEPPVWIALDEVVDPQNLGAIMRTAMFMGVDGVIVCHKNSAPLSPTASKASAGAMEERPTYGVTSLMKLVQESRENGWDIVGAHLSNGSKRNRLFHTWPETGVDKPTLLIMGNEGNGLRKQIANQCDSFIQIPCLNANDSIVESLNVSVATGVILSKLMRGRYLNLPKNLKMYPHRPSRKDDDDDRGDYDDDDDDDD